MNKLTALATTTILLVSGGSTVAFAQSASARQSNDDRVVRVADDHGVHARHHARHAEAGDDHGRHRTRHHHHARHTHKARHLEAGDDHGTHAEAGDDHGGRVGGHGADD